MVDGSFALEQLYLRRSRLPVLRLAIAVVQVDEHDGVRGHALAPTIAVVLEQDQLDGALALPVVARPMRHAVPA